MNACQKILMKKKSQRMFIMVLEDGLEIHGDFGIKKATCINIFQKWDAKGKKKAEDNRLKKEEEARKKEWHKTQDALTKK